MNYTRAQLDAMPDLEGSASNAKLKVATEDTRVWLVGGVQKYGVRRYEVIVETRQDGVWRATKRYPA